KRACRTDLCAALIQKIIGKYYPTLVVEGHQKNGGNLRLSLFKFTPKQSVRAKLCNGAPMCLVGCRRGHCISGINSSPSHFEKQQDQPRWERLRLPELRERLREPPSGRGRRGAGGRSGVGSSSCAGGCSHLISLPNSVCSGSSRKASSSQAKLMEVPVFPARPVRPIRCT